MRIRNVGMTELMTEVEEGVSFLSRVAETGAPGGVPAPETAQRFRTRLETVALSEGTKPLSNAADR